MERTPQRQGELQVPIPGHPGLVLVSAEPATYGPDVLRQIQSCLEQSLAARGELGPEQLRALLRLLGRPDELGAQPWVRAWGAGAPEGAGAAFAEAVRAAVARLEGAQPSGRADRRGAILRLRYLEGRSAKAARLALYLSESHYHRTHSAGLRWLAGELGARARAAPREMGVFWESCEPESLEASGT